MSTSRHSLDTVLHGADDGSSSDQDAATALSTEAGTASALDRFLDVSADMLVSGGSATTAAFDRYGLSLAASTAQIEDEDSEQQQQTQQQQVRGPLTLTGCATTFTGICCCIVHMCSIQVLGAEFNVKITAKYKYHHFYYHGY